MVEISKLLAASDEETLQASGVAGFEFGESIAGALVVGNTNEA
ncbi:hypothetical protein [Amycolatopsis sp. H20-H5]|nr:hypothetical protein [Amycolatopsis sp. H20-H5]MEC3976881.1 hypothetical protein [Amycolatopsis sp. H20-H5]